MGHLDRIESRTLIIAAQHDLTPIVEKRALASEELSPVIACGIFKVMRFPWTTNVPCHPSFLVRRVGQALRARRRTSSESVNPHLPPGRRASTS